MDSPKYVALVLDGNAKVLSTITGESEGAINTEALHAYTKAQQEWEAGPQDLPSPMWEGYARMREPVQDHG